MTVALLVCQILVGIGAAFGAYYLVMALPLSPLPAPPVPGTDKTSRFAVVVFAKDEAAVIGALLATLRAQDYPDDAYDIFVTADNCTDDTAQVARDAGAIVWEREDREHISKSYVQNWFFARFKTEAADRYDACIIFDADNLVDPGFLAAMNRERNRGHEVAMGYRLTKNPSASAVAGTHALFWLLQARLFHVGRTRRHLPCLTVGGTGYMFDLKVLPDGLWQTYSIVEDIEFTLNSIADGHNVVFTYEAKFYDEQPVTWWQSLKQRYRWSLGSLQMVRYATPHLLRTLPKYGWRHVDATLFSIGSLIQGTSGLAGFAMTLLLGAITGQWARIGLITLASTIVGYLVVAAVGRIVLALEHRWWPGAWRAVAVFPIFTFTWAILYVVVLFYQNRRWSFIPHTHVVSLEQVTGQLPTSEPGDPAVA